MARTVRITVPSDATDALISVLSQADGIIGLQVQRAISLKPAGDAVDVLVTNRKFLEVMRLLDEYGIGRSSGSSATTSMPESVLATPLADPLLRDSSESSWEEMEFTLARESNATADIVLLMSIVGIIAATGILTNALHVVIAAMVIAPGFEPITRVALGIINTNGAVRRGLYDIVRGYLALAAGAAEATLVMRLYGYSDLASRATYLSEGALLSYWTSFSGSSLAVSGVASLAGAILIAAHRSVLTAGVMIALALIPSACLAAMGLAMWDLRSAGHGLLRWALEVTIVLVGSILVFAWKRARVHQRRSML